VILPKCSLHMDESLSQKRAPEEGDGHCGVTLTLTLSVVRVFETEGGGI
jgi:hypothetical protein